MPRRTDLRTILVIGSGPIVIGQGCEFDYSGTQACKALREEGYRVVLVNSNPATIMTDPDTADSTYVEPLTVQVLERIIEAEKPQALLPTIGGQTGLNLALDAAQAGVLARHGVELIGANVEAIKRAEDRERFRQIILELGLDAPRSGIAHSLQEAQALIGEIGLPAIVRASRTLGGAGGSFAHDDNDFNERILAGLDASPIQEVLIEESIAGWKEFELEVVRDRNDNVIIVCSIENLDPMGVHTGDSITVAPIQTLTDKEYQAMRDAAVRIIRAIGVDTGGSNIQFAMHPNTGRMVVIEMNPRVSRSSALASKATGFPIAKIAAKLAVGYSLDELDNDITQTTSACFEPSIDYVVTKIPRFAFEKFPGSRDALGPQMKSVGEVMAMGRTMKESLQKALRSLETGSVGFDPRPTLSDAELKEGVARASSQRLWLVGEALRRGMDVEQVYGLTGIDRWFLRQIGEIVGTEATLAARELAELGADALWQLKRDGFSDARLAALLGVKEAVLRERRQALGVRPVFKSVDTCGAEFEATTPYFYSSYEPGEDECQPSSRRKVLILGSGPNRIGQGIEFDYCCVHAVQALREDGFETIMVNCNPETVSTDYDTSDKLFFEPLTLEDVLEIVVHERPQGVIVSFGGQTPLGLAHALQEAGVPILGTTPDAIDRTEDRERFDALLEKLQLRRPDNGMARSGQEAAQVADRIGYPVLLRPSYVLGGRGMRVVHDPGALHQYMQNASKLDPPRPVLVDRFLEDAIEVDADGVCDGSQVIVGGVMEHIERAGIHSGDSACALPAVSLSAATEAEIRRQTVALAKEIGVVGLINVQFAVKDEVVHVLEVNPRASRSIPFVSKAVGLALAKVAARCMTGRTLADQGLDQDPIPSMVSVKESVFPFIKFEGVDTMLGPEMMSTGEVMGVDSSFAGAFAKAQTAAGTLLPTAGRAFISVPSASYAAALPIARQLSQLGFSLVATRGTAASFRKAELQVETINKVAEGMPHTVDLIRGGGVCLVINAPGSAQSFKDSLPVRRAALECRVPYFTTLAAASAAAEAIALCASSPLGVQSLQAQNTHRSRR